STMHPWAFITGKTKQGYSETSEPYEHPSNQKLMRMGKSIGSSGTSFAVTSAVEGALDTKTFGAFTAPKKIYDIAIYKLKRNAIAALVEETELAEKENNTNMSQTITTNAHIATKQRLCKVRAELQGIIDIMDKATATLAFKLIPFVSMGLSALE